MLVSAAVAQLLVADVATSEAIRRKATEVVARAEYQLDEGLTEESLALWMTLLRLLLESFLWLFNVMGSLPPFLKIIVIVVLVVVAVALITHIIWSIVAAIRGQRPVDHDAAAKSVWEANPEELEAAADRAATDGRYLEAIRLLFKAALIRIERSQQSKLRVGITNRDLLRRYRNSSLEEPLTSFVDIIDRKWFGGEDCHAIDFQACLNDQLTIRHLTGGTHNVLRA